jgi:hypothetical protein
MVLNVLRQHKRPGLKDEDPSAPCGIGDQEMFCYDPTKGATTDHDHIKITSSSRDALCGAIERLLQRVAEKASHVVQCEGSGFRR